ncbi:MAG: SGNH/GDSL hydrolase family protein [Anaerolineales bacterium]|nr:SGNH/GDSL hydrolase family protein [Anaerolineales bacterium]
MFYWLGYGVILILGAALGGSSLVWLRRRPGESTGITRLVENISLALLVFFLTFMLVELGFKLFFAQSDGFRYTLASQNWYERYWQENSLGYRDVEWTPEKLAGKTKVMVVGDSFVAGSGIANPQDRFSNQLGRLLGDNYAVLNVASPGWDTVDEVEAILNYPYRPDMLVLSYYINDIEGTAYQTGAQRPQIRQDPPTWLLPLVQNSYAVNFLYWRIIRLGPQEWAEVYWNDWLKKISTNPDILWQHQEELLKIIDGAASEQIPLFVVVFPNLAAVNESQPFIQPVIDLFQTHEVPVLDVSKLLAGRDPATTTVNAIDSHPNEAINREVAERLYQMIIQQSQKISTEQP